MFAILFNLIYVSADLSLWQDTLINNQTNIVRYHAFYQFDDTSANNIGNSKPIELRLDYNVLSLPYSLAYGSVDWCNFTAKQYTNRYNTSTQIISTTPIIAIPIFTFFAHYVSGDVNNIFFNSGSYNDYVTFTLFAKDTVEANMDCHYTDTRSLYQENVLVGRFTTYLDSFSCNDCSEFTFQQ
jgi:hypothetical protein